MNARFFSKAVLLCTVVLLGATLTSWRQGSVQATKNIQDTVPPKRDKKVQDLDETLKELDNATEDLKKSMREVDWEKVNAEVKAAMKNIDVDIKKLSVDLKKSLQEVDVEKMRQEVEASVAKIDWDEIKKELEKVKTVDLEGVKKELESVKVELQKLKPEIEENLQEAKQSLEKAKAELTEYKNFMDGLERDGLINKKGDYKIEHQNGKLLINGKQQPADVYNKYRTFLEKNRKFTLQKDNNGFKMNND